MLLITILIITGLVIDLGGGPNHDRLGFRVRPVPYSLPSSPSEPLALASQERALPHPVRTPHTQLSDVVLAMTTGRDREPFGACGVFAVKLHHT